MKRHEHRAGRKMVWLLALVLGLTLAGCAEGGERPSASGGASPSPAPAQSTASGDAVGLLEGSALYSLEGGLTLAIPQNMAEQVLVLLPDQSSEQEASAPVLLSVYETQSYEESMEDYGYGAGFLFSVIRYDPVAYEQDYLACQGGAGGLTIFARDENWYYGWSTATDVQYYRRDTPIDQYDAGWAAWEALFDSFGAIQADFIQRNGLDPYDGAADLSQDFFWPGEHRSVSYHNHDWSLSMTLVLAQPARQGEGGIWCVEQWYDNSCGNQYWVLPQTDVPAADYYAALQAQAELGESPELLDPLTAALNWLREDQHDSSLQVDQLDLLDCEPAGNVFRRIDQVLDKLRTAELGVCSGGQAAGGQRCSPPAENQTLPSALYPIVWARAETPAVMEGSYLQLTAADGSSLLFLETGDLLRVTQDGAEEWFTPAYAYARSAYTRVSDVCRSWSDSAG